MIKRINILCELILSHDTLYIILSRSAFWKKISNHSVVLVWYWNKSFVLIYEDSTSKRISKAEQKSRFIFRDVNRSIALQSPYMQIRVKLFVLNENAAKHLHLDPCQSTRISGSKWVKPRSSKFRTTGTARTKWSFVPAYMTMAAIITKLTNQHLDRKMCKIYPIWRTLNRL